MGRQLRRVPLDFNWPLNQPYEGFLNNHYRECPAKCEGGYSEEYRALSPFIGQIMSHASRSKGALLRVGVALNDGREPDQIFGFCGTGTYAATVKILDAAQLPHTCATCNGDGVDPAVKDAYEAWVPTEPPIGDGWQLWETVSEGSPITPVFDSAEGLANWLVRNDTTVTRGRSWETWMKFLTGPGWAPSGVMINGEYMGGVEGVAR